MKLSPKGKTNSPEEFVPPREKVVERPTPPWGRFISPRENDVGKFRKCSSRKRVFSPRGKFTSLNGKIVGKDNSPRKKAGERHVYPLMPMFLKGGPISPRYKNEVHQGRFHFSKEFGRGKTCFSSHTCFLKGRASSPMEEVVEKEKPMKCIIPLVVSPGQRWHVVQHKKFPQMMSKTQKRRM